MCIRDRKKLEPAIRLSIKNPESDSGSVFGRGIADLCLGVRETGSLNAAAKGMGMAYSKAWRIIKETEAALGIQLLNRDGAHGSDLTDEGDVYKRQLPRGQEHRLDRGQVVGRKLHDERGDLPRKGAELLQHDAARCV